MDVAELCSHLIRFNSSQPDGDERRIGEYLAGVLTDLGLQPTVLEAEPRRTNVIARIPGRRPNLGGLLVHAHTDVVPANPAEWTVPPFSGQISDGLIHGRGAVDMKNMIAMTVTAVEAELADGWQPERDVVLAFVADEEQGSRLGARWLMRDHAHLFDGVTHAIGEAGGFSFEFPGQQRAYFVQIAEKPIRWIHLETRGRAGHASMPSQEDAISNLLRILSSIASTELTAESSPTHQRLSDDLIRLTGQDRLESAVASMGSVGDMLSAALRSTVSTTVVSAGSQPNVIPASASAVIDVRTTSDSAFDELVSLLADQCTATLIRETPGAASVFEGPLAEILTAAISRSDPGAVVIPTPLPIGTDAKFFSQLGIACYGFIPMRTPAKFNLPAMFHGVDECVPVEALEFGTRVLRHVLASS
jgi:acetylornithine deacetylase/succinyl-diaminopimelate desuccinylase-like protein